MDEKIQEAYFNESLKVINDAGLLSDRARLCDLVSNLKPKLIIHLASKHKSQMNREFENIFLEEMITAGTLATQNLIYAIKHKSNITKLIVASSSRIYTPAVSMDWKNEKSNMNPVDQYGFIKKNMREICTEAREAGYVNCGTAILFNHDSIYNSNDYLGGTIARHVINAQKNKSYLCTLRDLSAMGDFSHAEDICLGMSLMADQDELKDFVFGSGVILEVGYILRKSLDLFDLEDVEITSSNPGSIERKALGADITQAKYELHWEPRKSIFDAIGEMVSQHYNLSEFQNPL